MRDKKARVLSVKEGNKDKKKAISDGKRHKGDKRTKTDIEATDIPDNLTPKGTSKRVSFSDKVEVFPPSDEPDGAESGEDEGLVQGKRFSLEEDKIIKEAVSNYIETHGLGEKGEHMILNCISYPEVKGCWKEIGSALPWRTKISVYNRAHVLFERDEKRTWSAEDFELVKKFHDEHGSNWKALADQIGKYRVHIKDAWRRIRLPNRNKGRWSQVEYQSLFDLVNMDLCLKAYEDEKKSKHGMLRDNICWEAISDKLSTRGSPNCCFKWYFNLTSPMVAEGIWADADDHRLIIALDGLDACCPEDVDWDNLIEHRSGDVSRKRWNQMIRHIGDYEKKSFAEQVEVLSKRYSLEVLKARLAYDSKPVVN